MPLRLLSKKRWVALVLLGVAVTGQAAEPSANAAKNASAPYEIQADNAVFDQQKGEGIYTGRVQMDKGTQHIRAQRVRLKLDANNKIQHIWADGKPVTFTDGEDISGRAQRMEYDLATQVINLYDDAKITQGERVVTGSTIIYHTQNQRIEAKGKQGERVKLVLPPDDTEDSSSSQKTPAKAPAKTKTSAEPAAATKANPDERANGTDEAKQADQPIPSAASDAIVDKDEEASQAAAEPAWKYREDAEFFEDAEFIEEGQ